jgi:hypothetical protein
MVDLGVAPEAVLSLSTTEVGVRKT